MSRKTKQEALELARRRRIIQQRNVDFKREFIRQRSSAQSEIDALHSGLHPSISKYSSIETQRQKSESYQRVIPFKHIDSIEESRDNNGISSEIQVGDDHDAGLQGLTGNRPKLIQSSPSSKRKLRSIEIDEKKQEDNISFYKEKPPLPKTERPKRGFLSLVETKVTEDEDEFLPDVKKKSKKGSQKLESKTKEVGKLEDLLQGSVDEFLSRPLKHSSGIVECYIERNKGSTSRRLFPEYHLFLKLEDKFLLAAKKRAKNRTSNYVISKSAADLERKSSNCIGKLRANFIGTEFQIFDNGSNPSKQAKSHGKENVSEQGSTDIEGIRSELGAVLYASNILGSRGPRRMRVAVPLVKEDGSRVICKAKDKKSCLLQRFKRKQLMNLMELINKPPRWNDQVGAYVLNFNGRVTMASVKNFQLVLAADEDHVVLQFGRVGKDLFTMDFAWPLSPLQAFAICLSSFDGKLACE